MNVFGGPRSTKIDLMLAKASADPRNALNGCHHIVIDAFEKQGRRVSLRTFSWEPPGSHRYQQPIMQQACAPEVRETLIRAAVG